MTPTNQTRVILAYNGRKVEVTIMKKLNTSLTSTYTHSYIDYSNAVFSKKLHYFAICKNNSFTRRIVVWTWLGEGVAGPSLVSSDAGLLYKCYPQVIYSYLPTCKYSTATLGSRSREQHLATVHCTTQLFLMQGKQTENIYLRLLQGGDQFPFIMTPIDDSAFHGNPESNEYCMGSLEFKIFSF